MAERKFVHVAVGVIRRHGRVLIARRPDHLHQGGLLEFPGGKVESGESVQQALVREILEETGLTINAEALQPLIGIRHDYGDKCVFLDVWETEESDGQPEGREGQAIEWREPDELVDEDFPAANRPIIRALKLPRRYAITGRAANSDECLSLLRSGLPGLDGSLCLLRSPELDRETYCSLAEKALALCGDNGVQLMLHGAPDLLGHVPRAAGVHLPWREAQRYDQRPVGEQYWLGVSCHSAEEIAHAHRLQADFVTLGTVNPTNSHPGAPSLGFEVFKDLVAGSPVVVFGLGGLVPADEPQVFAAGGQGIAGISYWWPDQTS